MHIIFQSSPRLFIWTLFGLSIPVLLAVFLINAILDPLWHFQGNMIRGVNYAFNERNMTINSLIHKESEFDCILFGSSRSTLLDVRRIRDNRCFNMSFSDGHIDEFLTIAKYLKNRGLKIKKIYFSVNEMSFTPFKTPAPSRLPAFISKGTEPPSILKDYLSLSALKFSYRTLRGWTPLPRAYKINEDGSISGFILNKNFNYVPAKKMKVHPDLFKSYQPENLFKFQELLALFPDAESLGYIAPISNWEQARIMLMGNLEQYVEIRYSLSQILSEGIIDFSIPSALTLRTDTTYDGIHYNAEINNHILDRLNDDKNKFGQQIQDLTEKEYKHLVVPPIQKFILDESLEVVARKPS